MTDYFFHVEAVNFSPTVYDTSDISTIRGGGFYLLDRIKTLAAETPYSSGLIAEGASKLVFRISLESDKDADRERKKILEKLYSDWSDEDKCLKEVMFLVAYVKETENFQEDIARLMGMVRTRQMQNPSVRIFSETLYGGISGAFDGFNHVLPAYEYLKGKEKNISKFTFDRRKGGIALRKSIYKKVLDDPGLLEKLDFTDSLEDLSVDPKQGNLNGKIAYIYIDGNKFGKLQSGFDDRQYSKFDHKINEFKKELLKELFKLAKGKPWFENNKKIRLETLLWGGDEIAFIVPAWVGWTVMKTFYETVEKGNNMILEWDHDKALTFAMGVVFTHHKNPIRNLNAVVRDLAEAVKNSLDKNCVYNRNKGNRCLYAVLESLEILPKKYELFAQDIYNAKAENLLMSLDDMKEIQELAHLMEKGFSRGKLYEIAHAWKASGSELKSDSVKKIVARGLNTSTLSDKAKDELLIVMKRVTGFDLNLPNGFTENENHGYRFLQLSELYDYLIWEGK